MHIEVAGEESQKLEISLSTQAHQLESEYYIEDGFSHSSSLTHRGLALTTLDTRHYGRCKPFLYWNGEPMCLLGPDWLFSLGLLFCFFLFFGSFKSVYVSGTSPILTYVIFITVQTIFLLSFVALAIKNPGVKSQPKDIEYVDETL